MITPTSMKKNPMTTQQQKQPNTLITLPSITTNGDHSNEQQRVFECKTCNRRFASFQALGGHRASHRKSRHTGPEAAQPPPPPPRIHECLICGLEFPLGQALGGHMRRHRANGVISASNINVSKRVDVKGFDLDLDLNVAPAPECEGDGDREWQQGMELELQVDLAEKVRFVEWLR